MTGKIYRTERFDKEHRHFGGVIHPSDFNTEYRGRSRKEWEGSSIAYRIESDFRREQGRRQDA